jgi:hypothetical protein
LHDGLIRAALERRGTPIGVGVQDDSAQIEDNGE